MKCSSLLGAIFLILLFPLFCFSQTIKERALELERLLKIHPQDQKIFQSLHDLIAEQYEELSKSDRRSIRDLLKEQGKWSLAELSTLNEAGKRISITGKVVDEKGKPITDARLYVYHADNNGYYNPNDPKTNSMGESDPRLFGFLQSDKSGWYEIRTVRPASYPKKYEGRFIPQHIHFTVGADGFATKTFQLIFEDDPAMSDQHWKAWAKDQNYPIVRLIDSGKLWAGVLNIVLKK